MRATTMAGAGDDAPGKNNYPNEYARPQRTVAEAIQLVLATLDVKALKPLSPEATSPASQARALLVLLLNCYVHQIYSSKVAANLAARDPEFPWLWWENFPDARALRRFREENLTVLRACLTVVLRLLAEQKIMAGTLTKINAAQLAEEANRRITMAAFADAVEPNRSQI